MHWTCRIICHLCILVSFCACALPVWAQENSTQDEKKAQAQSYYNQAITLFGQGRHREAVIAFDKAIQLNPVPVYYCNKAIAQLKLNQLGDAIKSTTTCRDTFKGDQQELAKIDARLKAFKTVADHTRANSRLTAQSIALKSKVKKTVITPPAKPIVDDSWNASDWGYISIAIGGALLASALTLDWLSADAVDTLKTQSKSGNKQDYDEARATIEQRQPLFWGLTIGGSLLSALGVGLITYHYLGQDTDPQATPSNQNKTVIAPIVGPDQLGVQWQWQF